jgi:precorrin-4/cobalt-precorrin-4 C11-methyltransferase
MKRCTMLVALSLSLLSALQAHAAPGKFYLIGMGTAPDLVTVRGAEAIKQTDIFLLEEPGEKDYWKSFIGDKEVWFCAHSSRIFYGTDPATLKDDQARALCLANAKLRQDTVDKIKAAVAAGKTVSSLQGGDCMIYGTTFYLEMLPKDFPAEVIPGISAFNAASAAVKMSPTFGWNTDSVVLTMADWPGRVDTGEKFMAIGTSLVYYTMHMNYPTLFAQLNKHYPALTPVAIVAYAGDREKQQVIRSTVGSFLTEVDYKSLPPDMHMLLVGKFLVCGQGRLDGVSSGKEFDLTVYGKDRK